MRTLVITKRAADYRVAFKDTPTKWGAGGTLSSAIGELVRTFPEDFGVVIEHAARPISLTLPSSVDNYHAHLAACAQCRNNPFAQCAIGHQLLQQAAVG